MIRACIQSGFEFTRKSLRNSPGRKFCGPDDKGFKEADGRQPGEGWMGRDVYRSHLKKVFRPPALAGLGARFKSPKYWSNPPVCDPPLRIRSDGESGFA